MATRWEYKLKVSTVGVDALTQHLTDEGAEGWEIVTAVNADSDDTGPSVHLIFRRDVTNPTWDQEGSA